METGTCKNCGGDKSLHHWQTMQCPFGGREAPIGKPDQWTASTFEPVTDELAALTARVKELEEALARLAGSIDIGELHKCEDRIGFHPEEIEGAILYARKLLKDRVLKGKS